MTSPFTGDRDHNHEPGTLPFADTRTYTVLVRDLGASPHSRMVLRVDAPDSATAAGHAVRTARQAGMIRPCADEPHSVAIPAPARNSIRCELPRCIASGCVQEADPHNRHRYCVDHWAQARDQYTCGHPDCRVIFHRRRSETKSGLCVRHQVARVQPLGTARMKAGLA
jgi:hypothetical protein